MRKFVLALCLFFLAGVGVTAAQNQVAADPARIKAAEELLASMKMEESFEQSIETMLKTQLDAEPLLAQFEDILRDFARKYLTWSAVKEEYVALYADVFTESELRDLTAFHETPLGRKLLVTLPDLMVREQQITQKIVETHSKELQDRIKERMKAQHPLPPDVHPGESGPAPAPGQPKAAEQPKPAPEAAPAQPAPAEPTPAPPQPPPSEPPKP